MNECYFDGNLTKDVQVRTTGTGKQVGTFSIACNRKVGDDFVADYPNVVLWGPFDFDRLKKGTRVFVKGRLQTRSYEQNGTKKYVTEIVASIVEVIERKPKAAPGDFSQFGEPDPFGKPSYMQEDIPF